MMATAEQQKNRHAKKPSASTSQDTSASRSKPLSSLTDECLNSYFEN